MSNYVERLTKSDKPFEPVCHGDSGFSNVRKLGVCPKALHDERYWQATMARSAYNENALSKGVDAIFLNAVSNCRSSGRDKDAAAVHEISDRRSIVRVDVFSRGNEVAEKSLVQMIRNRKLEEDAVDIFSLSCVNENFRYHRSRVSLGYSNYLRS